MDDVVAHVVVEKITKFKDVEVANWDTAFEIRNAHNFSVGKLLLRVEKGYTFKLHGYPHPLLVMRVGKDTYRNPLNLELEITELRFYCEDAYEVGTPERPVYLPQSMFDNGN